MSKTSTAVKQRWINKTYKRVMVNLRTDTATDRRLLQFLDEHKDEAGTTEIIRQALEEYIMKHYPDFGK